MKNTNAENFQYARNKNLLQHCQKCERVVTTHHVNPASSASPVKNCSIATQLDKKTEDGGFFKYQFVIVIVATNTTAIKQELNELNKSRTPWLSILPKM